MKNSFRGIIALALLTACAHDDIPNLPTTDSMTDTPITFQIEVAETTSRVGYVAGELTEGAMGFYMQTAGTDGLEATTASKYNGINRQIECVAGKWRVEGYPLLWRNKTDEVSWQAYYPYTEENIVDGILTVTIPTDQAKDGAYDLLYGKGKTTGADSKEGINIEMKHLLSKLIVNLSIGSELSDAEVESVVISNIFTQCEFEIYNDRWWDGLGVPNNINMAKNTDGSFEALLIPYSTSQLNIDITLKDGRKFYYKQGTTTLTRGKVHTLDIQVGKNKVETAKMITAKWK